MDLNNILFEQMERLNDEEQSDEELMREIERSKSMKEISSQIIENSKLALEAQKLKSEYGVEEFQTPKMLE